jgi:hypothetical protein
VAELKRLRCVETEPRLKVTGLGRVCAMMYYRPEDVHAWWLNFRNILDSMPPGWDVESAVDAAMFCKAFTDNKTFNEGFLSRADLSQCDYFMRLTSDERPLPFQKFAAAMFYRATCHSSVLEGKSMFPLAERGILGDMERIFQAIRLIDQMYGRWNRPDLWNSMEARIKYAVPKEMVPLVRIKGIGSVFARKLWAVGIKSLPELLANRPLAWSALGKRAAAIFEAAEGR